MPNMRSRLKSGDALVRVRRNQMGWLKPFRSENPYAEIPRDVLKQLASEQIVSKELYTQRLNELMAEKQRSETS